MKFPFPFLARSLTNIVITGFNTDIQHQGVTYHVQTEDKGFETPLILSLVYDGGTILASKRSSYNDLLAGVFDESVLAERLQKQHKLMCAAVRAGRIEDLKRMTMKESASKQKGLIAHKQVKKLKDETPAAPESKTAIENEKSAKPFVLDENSSLLELSPVDLPAAPAAGKISDLLTDSFAAEPIIEAFEIIEEVIEEEVILPADAVAIFGGSPEPERVVDNKLKIELLDEAGFKGGERKTLKVFVYRGGAKKASSGAQILVKILGSSFRPLIFHSKTDAGGVAVVDIQLPRFTAGRAAILVRATYGGEEAEIRRVIQQG